MPDARCTRSRLCSKKHRRQQLQVHRINRHSLRNGFNGVLRALLGDHAWLPPSSADRSAHLAPASERQDHTTSPSAQPPFVRAIIALGDVRPSHPVPNVRDDREAPSCGCGTAETVSLIWVKREAEYFCAKGWTAFRMRRFFARRANHLTWCVANICLRLVIARSASDEATQGRGQDSAQWIAMTHAGIDIPPSWPGLSRPSTSCLASHTARPWMPGTSPGMTEQAAYTSPLLRHLRHRVQRRDVAVGSEPADHGGDGGGDF
jgi:hypothetical protein